jgi:hypothetical protein
MGERLRWGCKIPRSSFVKTVCSVGLENVKRREYERIPVNNILFEFPILSTSQNSFTLCCSPNWVINVLLDFQCLISICFLLHFMTLFLLVLMPSPPTSPPHPTLPAHRSIASLDTDWTISTSSPWNLCQDFMSDDAESSYTEEHPES